MEERTVYGPFHRIVAPGVQDAATVVAQMLSGELWGKQPRWGGSPAVKAYPGRLPDDESGIEFWAFARPDSPLGPRLYWRTERAHVTVHPAVQKVKLSVAFVRITQDLH